MPTIADLVHQFDAASRTLAAALKKTGPQWMRSGNNRVWVIQADDTSATGLSFTAAGEAATTPAPGSPAPPPTPIQVIPVPTPTIPTPTTPAPTATSPSPSPAPTVPNAPQPSADHVPA